MASERHECRMAPSLLNGVYEILVGKGAVNVRRDPLQRVRDDGVPTGS
jgi:hypothetical protein